MNVDDRIAALLPRLLEIRHDLHRHPELGFEERRSQQRVCEFLRAHGYQPQARAGTGVVADLRPGSGPTIALRADLDALPMHETTDLPYRSVHEGVAHKCGHDGHTTILLGVAALLAEQRQAWPNNVRLLFQPAEEGVRGGGARLMVAEGVLDGVQAVFGLHNWPGFPLGEVRVCAGPAMAQVDNLGITVRGQGGHGGLPQVCRDPIVAAAHIVTALQAVVARGVGSRGPVVVSIGSFHAGTTHNVIPGIAELKGTIRTFDPDLRTELLARLEEAVRSTARAHRTEVDWRLTPEYPVLINDADCAAVVSRVAEQVVGVERVSAAGLPLAAAEDFAFFAQRVPAAYFFVGAGDPVGATPGCHHPDFDFDDRLLPTAIKVFLGLASGARGDHVTGAVV